MSEGRSKAEVLKDYTDSVTKDYGAGHNFSNFTLIHDVVVNQKLILEVLLDIREEIWRLRTNKKLC